MEIFYITLNQMIVLALLILLGFILRKTDILPAHSASVMSKLEIYVFVPALNLSTWLNKCNAETFAENSSLLVCGFLFTAAAILISYPLSALFVRNTGGDADRMYLRNIYKYAMVFSNFGFMGNAIVLGVWGSDMFFKYSMFTLCISVLCYSWGLYVLTPVQPNTKMTAGIFIKRLLTPAMIVLPIGMIGGFLGVKNYIPDFVTTVLDSASSCMGPVSMLLAGVVIGEYDLRAMLTNKKVYLATAMRLIVIPAVLLLVVKFLGMSHDMMIMVLIAFASPLGLFTIIYPANYGRDTSTGASMTMISSTLSVVTIPLMYLVFSNL